MKSVLDTIPPTPVTLKSVTSKFKKNFKRGAVHFEIELFDGVLYIHNSLHLLIEIPYSDAKSKKRIYRALWLLPDMFDFSFTLEAYDIETLESFVMSAMVEKVNHPTVFGDAEQTQQRKYKMITDNLHLQKGDHVVDLYKLNPDCISLRQGLTKAESGDITTVVLNCVYRNPHPKKDGSESIVTKLTVNLRSSVTNDGREVKEAVAIREDGVTALIEGKPTNGSMNTMLMQPLRINMMYRYWYIDILQACFNVANKESETLWIISGRDFSTVEVA